MRTFWKLAALPLALALIFPAAASAQSSDVSVFVNGVRMSFDQPPVMQNGRVFVPLRGVFQQLGASVVYNNGQINATGSGRTISLTIGSTTAIVNGQQQTLDVAPFEINSRTLVPLRFIAQALGATVNWDDSSSAVTITSGGYRPGPNPRPPVPRPPQPPPAANVTFTSTSPTGTVYTSQPTVTFNLSRPARIATITVTVDGTNVNSALNQAANASISFRTFPLPRGKHRVRVYGKTTAGLPFDISWYFTSTGY
jgi:hypothetical protein